MKRPKKLEIGGSAYYACDDWEKWLKEEEIVNFIKAISDGRAFDKETGLLWDHWLIHAKELAKRIGV